MQLGADVAVCQTATERFKNEKDHQHQCSHRSFMIVTGLQKHAQSTIRGDITAFVINLLFFINKETEIPEEKPASNTHKIYPFGPSKVGTERGPGVKGAREGFSKTTC